MPECCAAFKYPRLCFLASPVPDAVAVPPPASLCDETLTARPLWRLQKCESVSLAEVFVSPLRGLARALQVHAGAYLERQVQMEGVACSCALKPAVFLEFLKPPSRDLLPAAGLSKLFFEINTRSGSSATTNPNTTQCCRPAGRETFLSGKTLEPFRQGRKHQRML